METETYYVNAFYIVACLAIVIITTGMVFIFKELIPLLRNLRVLSEKVHRETSLVIDDVENVRTGIHRIVKTLLRFANLSSKIFSPTTKSSKKDKGVEKT